MRGSCIIRIAAVRTPAKTTNASSTPLTLKSMLVIALVGMPIVIAYTIFIYRVFKGKVELTEASY